MSEYYAFKRIGQDVALRPLTEPEMLYELLSCAEKLLLIGHGQSLRSKRDLQELVDEIATEYQLGS